MKAKRVIANIAIFSLVSLLFVGCYNDYPIDEDGLLISNNAGCAVLNFDLLDSKNITVLAVSPPDIDTFACTIKATVRWRADITYLWPVFDLQEGCKLSPKIRERYNFTDSVQFTVISGNRKIKKTYTVYVKKEGE